MLGNDSTKVRQTYCLWTSSPVDGWSLHVIHFTASLNKGNKIEYETKHNKFTSEQSNKKKKALYSYRQKKRI